MHTIGIDFGTTKTLVTRINPVNHWPVSVRLGLGSDYIPTAVYIDDNGQMYFGEEAEERMTEETGVYLPRFKMQLGSATPLHMCFTDAGRMLKPTAMDLVREYLRYIRQRVESKVFMAENSVSGAVITRPVNFSPAQLDELKNAAHAAGFKEVQLTTEPEAAGLAFCRLNVAKTFQRSALVVDWGGGTLDFALVTRDGDTVRTHPRLTDGDTTMGGEHFDDILWYYAEQHLRRMGINQLSTIAARPALRRAKERLSSDTMATLRLSHSGGACPPIEITRAQFEELIIDDVNKAAQKVKALIERIPAADKPEMLLLVGGSCRIPLIKTTLEAACGLPAYDWEHSREAVALGAALWGQKLPTAAPSAPPAPVAATAPAAAEHAENFFKEGEKYYFGQGVTQDYTQAVYWYRKAAEQGYASGQNNLGYMYRNGLGVTQDYTQAVYWFRKAAEQGDADAQSNLGDMYEAGLGVTQDYTQAVYWYRKAAEQGDADAQNNLGYMYEAGHGVTQDYTQAAQWYHKAAEQGHAVTQYNLGYMYDNGHGVTQDYTQAAQWYRKAAEQGYARAQNNLGAMYEAGHGVTQDYKQAVYWYRKAAEQGFPRAQYLLGRCYENGHGKSKDKKLAREWYQKAAAQGHEEAKAALKHLTSFFGKLFG